MQLKTGITFLLLACGFPVHAADPVGYGRHAPEGVRAVLLQNAAVDRGISRSDMSSLAPVMPVERRGQENVFPEARSAIGPGLTESGPAATEGGRRARALSPEERRMLRRQIDEVGHDIYSQRR